MKIYVDHKNWVELLHWLQDNIGPVLHSRPIVFWHGSGWYLHRGIGLDVHRRWEVDITDEKKAMLFALKWS